MLKGKHGQLGVLSYDAIEDKVQCHICGKWFRGLNNHVFRTHGWAADDYREEFGLKRGQSLICEGTRQLLSNLNKELCNWRYLNSQTMTKEELNKFLRSVQAKPGYHLRRQTLLLQSERLKLNNPMSNPVSAQRRTTTLHRTWYGTPRHREIGRANIRTAMATVRKRNLDAEKYTCPCGEIFPIRKEGEHHRKHCAVARGILREKRIKARKQYLKELTPERRQEINRHVSEGKKRQYATREVAV